MDTLFVEYRGYGASGGDVNLLWALDDVRAVFEQVNFCLCFLGGGGVEGRGSVGPIPWRCPPFSDCLYCAQVGLGRKGPCQYVLSR